MGSSAILTTRGSPSQPVGGWVCGPCAVIVPVGPYWFPFEHSTQVTAHDACAKAGTQSFFLPGAVIIAPAVAQLLSAAAASSAGVAMITMIGC
jgi:hypothetical protein